MNTTQAKSARSLTGFLSSIILLLLMLSIAYTWKNGSDYKIEMSIPFNANENLRQSNGIKKLSEEIRAYPHAKIYVVILRGNNIYADGRLRYNHVENILTYKHMQPMGNGMISGWNHVNDTAINKAASNFAQFNDMGSYRYTR